MRIKTLLLTAGLVAAGVATSMAQSNVYSLNVVGYVNLTVVPGYNLIANQLDVDGIDNVNVALTNGVPDQTQLSQFTGAGFTSPIIYYAGYGWFDQNFNAATNTVYPGKPFFLYNSGTTTNTVTLVGTVLQSTNSFAISAGYGFYSVVPPVASDLDTNAFPAEDQMQYTTFTAGHGYTSPYIYYAGYGWFDQNFNQVFPTPAVGTGFVIYNPDSATNWVQSFTVN
jgi:hypothetical protein